MNSIAVVSSQKMPKPYHFTRCSIIKFGIKIQNPITPMLSNRDNSSTNPISQTLKKPQDNLDQNLGGHRKPNKNDVLYKSIGGIRNQKEQLRYLDELRRNNNRKNILQKGNLKSQERIARNKSSSLILKQLEQKVCNLRKTDNQTKQEFTSEKFIRKDPHPSPKNEVHSQTYGRNQEGQSKGHNDEDTEEKQFLNHKQFLKMRHQMNSIQINSNNDTNWNSRNKKRTSAPIIYKSGGGEYWNQIFDYIKEKGKNNANSNDLVKVQQALKSNTVTNLSQKVFSSAFASSDLNCQISTQSKGIQEIQEESIVMKSRQRAQYFLENTQKKSTPLKKSTSSKDHLNIKQRSQLSLSNAEPITSSIRNQAYSTQTTKKDAHKPSQFKVLKKQSFLESTVCYTEQEVSTNQQVENGCKNNRIGSQGVQNILGSQINAQKLSKRQQNQGHNSIFSNKGEMKQRLKRIYSPMIEKPIKNRLSLSDFQSIEMPDRRSALNEEKNKIGNGKFGSVFLCRHKQTKAILALKQVSKQKIKSYKMIEQAIDEIKIHTHLCHPNIVKLFGFFEEGSSIFLILEYMQGGTVFDYLNLIGKIPLKTTLKFLKDIITAITYIHEKNIAHRDIKPENILLTDVPTLNTGQNDPTAKLCDFGWAAVIEDSRRTYCGTFDYVPPEILERKKYDISVDVWSIGILAYEMMTGKVPYEGDRSTVISNKLNEMQIKYPEISPEFPIEAKQFINSLTRKNPEKRPKSKELLDMALFRKYDKILSNQIHLLSQQHTSERRERIRR